MRKKRRRRRRRQRRIAGNDVNGDRGIDFGLLRHPLLVGDWLRGSVFDDLFHVLFKVFEDAVSLHVFVEVLAPFYRALANRASDEAGGEGKEAWARGVEKG